MFTGEGGARRAMDALETKGSVTAPGAAGRRQRPWGRCAGCVLLLGAGLALSCWVPPAVCWGLCLQLLLRR